MDDMEKKNSVVVTTQEVTDELEGRNENDEPKSTEPRQDSVSIEQGSKPLVNDEEAIMPTAENIVTAVANTVSDLVLKAESVVPSFIGKVNDLITSTSQPESQDMVNKIEPSKVAQSPGPQEAEEEQKRTKDRQGLSIAMAAAMDTPGIGPMELAAHREGRTREG